ncbi:MULTISPECIES: hypothetical protein [unclassified Burkholderia]|uniref:hypothetical protein n=1 Tax=unclassified Burkholderia TaxID=2613784 RepID=UPI001E582D39|nr:MULTISPECIES: hypothetical protein [unclassified Burkholderia]UEP32600.1 hypothetical protein LMA01_34805 [Burkholderia sp. B21-007]UEP46341.1 hypothetical protein LMA02_31470 [Burkholderia sp. B21-005]
MAPILEQIVAPQPGMSFPIVQAAGKTPSRRAAELFQEKFQATVLRQPGSVKASRDDLGIAGHQLAMVDIGGEGQKTEQGAKLMKSGNVHAINVNAQSVASPGTFVLQTDPSAAPVARSRYPIPNLVRPANRWPGQNDAADGFLPFEDGFSNLTMTEGAPVFDYHVKEFARVTAPHGWMILAVDDSFAGRLDRLAQAHNGGTVWKFPPRDGEMNRYVIPPRTALDHREVASQYKAMWRDANAHDVFDVAQTIALHRVNGLSLDEARKAAAGLRDVNGVIDLSRAAQPVRQHDEL